MEHDTPTKEMSTAEVHHFHGEAFQMPGLPTSLLLCGGGQGSTDLYAGPQEMHNTY